MSSERVRHKTFGDGTILRELGTGGEVTYEIRFTDGVRRVAARFVNRLPTSAFEDSVAEAEAGYRTEDFPKAARAYESAMTEAPTNELRLATRFCLLSYLCWDQDRLADAQSLCDSLLASPLPARLRCALMRLAAETLHRRGLAGEAIAAYGAALRASITAGDRESAHAAGYNAGVVCAEAALPGATRSFVRAARVIRKHSDKAEALVAAASFATQHHRLDLAERCLRACLGLRLSSLKRSLVRLFLSRVFIARCKVTDAVSILAHDGAEFPERLAVAHYLAGDLLEADRLFAHCHERFTRAQLRWAMPCEIRAAWATVKEARGDRAAAAELRTQLTDQFNRTAVFDPASTFIGSVASNIVRLAASFERHAYAFPLEVALAAWRHFAPDARHTRFLASELEGSAVRTGFGGNMRRVEETRGVFTRVTFEDRPIEFVRGGRVGNPCGIE